MNILIDLAQDPHLVNSTKSFIELVKQHPNIWDPNSPKYSHKTLRNDSWKEIFRRVDPTYDAMTKAEKRLFARSLSNRWRNIRLRYIRSSKLSPEQKKVAGNSVFNDCLKFLDGTFDTLDNDEASSSTNNGSRYNKKGESLKDEIENNISSENDFDIENNYEFEEQEDDNILIQEDKEAINEPPRKQHKTIETAESETEKKVNNENKDKRVIAILSDIMEKEMDDDRAFFQSMLRMVKKLNESSKLEFRIKLMKLIKNLKEMETASSEAPEIKSEPIESHYHYH